MSRKLGNDFARVAYQPLSRASHCFTTGDVEQGLLQLPAAELRNAVHQALLEVSAVTGLSTKKISKLLPIATMEAAARQVVSSQPHAKEQWDLHAAHHGGLLAAIAKVTAFGSPLDVVPCLRRVSEKMKLEQEFGAALGQLAGDIERWTVGLDECRGRIEDGRELTRAMRRRTWLRRGFIVISLIAIGVMLGVASSRQRLLDRIDAQLTSKDPCTVRTLGRALIRQATGLQKKKIRKMRKRCEVIRATEKRVAKAKARSAQRRLRHEKARAARHERCQSIALELESRSPGGAIAKHPLRLRLERIARDEVEPADLRADWSRFECNHTPSIEVIGAAFMRAALAGAARWMKSIVPSRTATLLMNHGQSKVSAHSKRAFADQVERFAAKAVRSGKIETMAHATRVCAFKIELRLGTRQACKAAQTVDTRSSDR